MTIALRNVFNKKNYIKLSLILLNAITLIFIIVNACLRSQSVIADAFTVIMLIVFAMDAVYGMRSNNKYGGLLIICITFLAIVNGAAFMITGLSAFKTSLSVVAIIALALIPLLSIMFIVLNIVKPSSSLVILHYMGSKLIETIILIALPIILFFFALIGYDLLFSGTTIINGFTSMLGFVIIFLIFGTFTYFLRVVRENSLNETAIKKNIAIVVLVAVITAFALSTFVTAEASANETKGYLNDAFVEKIESTTFEKVKRERQHSLSTTFFGIKTSGYNVDRNIEYFVSDREIDKGLSLKYDVYYPINEKDTSIIVNIHGSGGDKDIGNYAHRNKYFASLGYVVYDIQIGDYKEKGNKYNNVKDKIESRSDYLISNIEEFFKYIVSADRHGGNLDSVFVTGISMGGSLSLKIGLPLREKFEAFGVKLKGILPIYPGYWTTDKGTDNYLNFIDADSIPCLVVMGTRDAIVLPETPYYIADKYIEAGNNNFTCVIVEYAGHGMDASLTGRANQLIMYYAERFIELYATV